jgi:hypothetical protein
MTGQVGSGRPKSQSREDTQLSLAAVLATDLYFASVEERATVFYFLELQEIRLRPRYII